MEKAIFLDRDGTINVDKGYVHKPEDFVFMAGAPEAIRQMNKFGYKVIVISNQSGIARGFFTSDDVVKLHEHINLELNKYGARIDAYYFCPHHPDYDMECDCRKPKTGLIEQAVKDFNIDLTQSWMIGDKASDLECAGNIGLKAVLLLTGYGSKEFLKCEGIDSFEDLYQFIRCIKQHKDV